ncbi:MAG: peptidylprolyl isomerase [Zetaproteobacteria bacterium]|nr:MAG: peptidylprolyl isomerase [Zetaproteobacteria bacterium]
MQIAKHTVVTIDYRLTNDRGEVLDTSEGGEPLAYLHGADNLIPGLERELEGHKKGDRVEVTVEPEDAYGEYDPGMTQVVPRSMFEGVDEIEVGMQFQAQTPQGVHIVKIAKVDGDQITIDGNHPLAGERLHFDITVRDVREATPEEIEHGHVHGPGGHAH